MPEPEAGWAGISRRVKEEAGWKCERCGLQHGTYGWRDASAVFHPVPIAPLRAAGYRGQAFDVWVTGDQVVRIFQIVLTVAHLDHAMSNRERENLVALCQRCYLRHDLYHHIATRRRSMQRQARDAMQTVELFSEAAA